MTPTFGIYSVSRDCQIPSLPWILTDVFGEKKDGSFVEVGAFDGKTWSNTWGLAELGWQGVYVEPIKAHYINCVNNHAIHPKVHVLNLCIGDGRDVTMYGGMITTASKEYIDHGWATENLGVFPTITMDELMYEVGRLGIKHPIDLLVIDVEGMENKVLGGFSLSLFSPKMVIIEASEKHPDQWMAFNAEFINRYFERRYYRKIYSDYINNIYIAEEDHG